MNTLLKPLSYVAVKLCQRSNIIRFYAKCVTAKTTSAYNTLLRNLWRIWRDLWRPHNLEKLQQQLIDSTLSPKSLGHGIRVGSIKVPIDEENYINQIYIDVDNSTSLPRKHIVFLHGYGAALGLWSRNFDIAKQLLHSSQKFNYRIHFLDNITVGLSSNPKAKLAQSHRLWPRKCPQLNLIQDSPESQVMHNKYYKLVDSFEVSAFEMQDYKAHFKPIVLDIEDFYTLALEKWRNLSRIDKIDHLVGHSFGGYWCALYSLKYPTRVGQLVLILPVGVERHVHAITNMKEFSLTSRGVLQPSLDPLQYNLLSRWPILLTKFIWVWYHFLSIMPRALRILGGPFGVQFYLKLWLPKLAKINRVKSKLGINSSSDSRGSESECMLLAEYLYSAITTGSHSDRYIKQVLTPSTVAKWPLMDKFEAAKSIPFSVDLLYGQYDFMNSQAGTSLVNLLLRQGLSASIDFVPEGGHNLSIDNPFDTNRKLVSLFSNSDVSRSVPEIHDSDS